ncbi:MAG: peroxidase [Acidobacteriota bacterium]|nr:peroxidase [Acidobacteriota bacterium]
MLAYVEKLTRDATGIHPDDHDRLRNVGFDDVGILQITLIASWFNYINRVADALGVGREPASAVKTPAKSPPTRRVPVD